MERSKDGLVSEAIAEAEAVGNSASATHYGYFDAAPYAGHNYYRLRQVDTDGSFTHSAVRTAYIAQNGPGVRLVPNPGSGMVDVLLPSMEAGGELFLLDATGRAVLRMATGMERTAFDASALPPGLYGFRVHAPSGEVLGHGTWIRE